MRRVLSKGSIEVLVIEDDPNDVEFILHAIKESNIPGRVQVINDGQEALDYLFYEGEYEDRKPSVNPKVIFLDLKIPRVDGHDVLKAIRKNKNTSQIPVVVLTSSLQDQDVLSSYELGANSYIVKPVNFEDFLSVVKVVRNYWVDINYRP